MPACVGAGDEGTAMGGDVGSSVARSLPESDAGDCPALPSKRPFPRGQGRLPKPLRQPGVPPALATRDRQIFQKQLPTTKGDKPC